MNRKLLSLSVLTSALILSSHTFAKPQSGGFYGPTAPSASVTVAEAKNLKDESFVVLKGNIKQMVGKEKYLFEDKTGSIVIEIDDDDWNGLSVSPEDIVEIRGEVDTHWRKPTDIEVESITYITTK